MPETYDIKQMASHFVGLWNSWRTYVDAGLLSGVATVTIDSTTVYLRPGGGIWTTETRTVKNDAGVDVQQSRMITHTFDEYISNSVNLFNINKAIFTKLNALITFDLAGEDSEYAIYL